MPEKTVQKEPGKKPAPSKKPKPQQEVVVQIPLSKLHPFPDHPFQVREDASMQETAESVKEYGVLVPALARPREDGGYELIAGHRRKHACELAGLATMPVIVRDIDRDAATIIMVDSNLQRENILPSERAKEIYVKPTITNPNIIVGDFTYIADSDFESHVSHLYEWNDDKLIIGKFCQIAAGVEFVMNGANHQMNAVSTFPFYTLEGWEMSPPAKTDLPLKGDTVIENDVWIGQNSVILPGVHIGDGAIIGANSVVGSDVAPYTKVVGNPTRAMLCWSADQGRCGDVPLRP